MSRLEKHYKKQVTTYTILIVVAIILFGVYGLPLVINSSSYLSQLFGKRDDSDRRNPLLQTIEISEIPSATNSATFKIVGNTNNIDELEFYLNDEKIKEMSAPTNGEFSEELTGLNKGNNELYLIGKSKKGTKRTETLTIVYGADKPKLEISEPQDGSTTSHNEIKVIGKTDKEIDIKINGSPVVVDSSGQFQTNIKLNEGENKIIITARDQSGNVEEKIITVKYEKD